ncbi:hypothetical protein VTN77DRAFT_3433 [Rasamsonia byssochlamydoides]|uniref:uncharacterized protein n=1 Tax=Rasamsonia byssochlamydoides TaxID=89139 RepID=UPI0037431A74
MPNPDISAIVPLIVAAFESGMNIFRRLQDKRRQSKLNKKSRRKTTPYNGDGDAADKEEEERLRLSLRRGPGQIMSVYETNSGRFGDRFRRGDDLAQSSLTHTLLVFNAGLMRIISSIMSNDARNDELARRSLLDLSERSTLDAVNSLEDLCQRLIASSVGSPQSGLSSRHIESTSRRNRDAVGKRVPLKQQQIPRKRDKDKGQQKEDYKKATAAGRSKPSVSPGAGSKNHPRPEVVRGAWVRSRNGSSSSVTVITSAISRTQERTTSATISKRRQRNSLKANNNSAKYPTSGSLPASSSPDRPSSTALPSNNPSSQSPPSTHPQQQLPRGTTFPEQGQDIPKSSNNNYNNNNRVSILSIDSGGTKLGEIPRHKWLTPREPPVDSDDENSFEGEGDDDLHTRHRNRVGLRFWRRFRQK